MSTAREIKNRIKSVRDTQKITSAMYLISSTKMRKARRDAEGTKPYFDLLRREIRRVFALGSDVRSRYFDYEIGNADKDACYGILAITADKGLAGSYNQNVIKDTIALTAESDRHIIYSIGEYGRRYFKSRSLNVSEDFVAAMPEPSLSVARTITTILLDEFDKGHYDRLYVCFTDYTGGMSAGEATHSLLLPFDRDDFVPEGELEQGEKDASTVFEYEPGAEQVLDSIIPSYLSGFIYSALVNSYSSEQSARMMAMDAANDNASELIEHLSLEYNHLRQNAITQEITEVAAGARGQRRNELKRKKRREENE